MSTDTPSDCKVSQFSSRGCERGTLGCDVVHGPQVMIESLRRELAAAQADFKRLHEELLSTRAAASTQAERSGYYQDMFEQKERELAAALGEVEELRKELNLTTHKLITCGVAASHPDAALSTRGAYAGKWDSQQAQEVRKLRAQCDALRRNSERYIWLRDNHEINPKAGTICYEVCGRHWDAAIDAAMREAG